jgi:hypothetical protein
MCRQIYTRISLTSRYFQPVLLPANQGQAYTGPAIESYTACCSRNYLATRVSCIIGHRSSMPGPDNITILCSQGHPAQLREFSLGPAPKIKQNFPPSAFRNDLYSITYASCRCALATSCCRIRGPFSDVSSTFAHPHHSIFFSSLVNLSLPTSSRA